MESSSSTSDRNVCSATWVRYLVLMWLCSAATIAYIHRNSIGVAEEDIRLSLRLEKDQMGQLLGAFFITYAIFQIPAGWLAHVCGTRRALPLFSALWSMTIGAAGLAGGFPALLLSRLGMGAAQAGIFPASTSTIAKWFPDTQRATANGALGSFMSVGSAVGALLTGLLLEFLDWRWLFVLYSVPGMIWAAWFFVWFRDRPQEHPAVNAQELEFIRGSIRERAGEHSADRSEPTPWLALFTSPALAWICGQQFFRAAGYMFYASWFATFLKETRGVTNIEAGILTSLPFWSVVPGSFLGGLVSDWVLARTGSHRLSRQGIAVLSLGAAALFILFAYPVRNVWAFVLLISANSFLASFAGPCAYTVSIEMGGKHIATVFSTMNMFGNLGAMLFPVVVPWLVTGTEHWNRVLLLFAGLYVAAAICWIPFNASHTIFDQRRGDAAAR